MRISDWSSDVYSSDLDGCRCRLARAARSRAGGEARRRPDRRADRLAQTLFRVAAFFDPFRGKRIGGLDVLRDVDFLPLDRTRVVMGKSVSVHVYIGGSHTIKKTKTIIHIKLLQ